MLHNLNTIAWTRVIALFAYGLGLTLSGPALITITTPGMFEDFFAIIAIVMSLGGLGMLSWLTVLLIIYVTSR